MVGVWSAALGAWCASCGLSWAHAVVELSPCISSALHPVVERQLWVGREAPFGSGCLPYVLYGWVQADKSERVLFPDRGSKIELGKVFHPLAFGSTKPRNMMPGHLTAEGDPRAQRNLTRLHAEEDKLLAGRMQVCRHAEGFDQQ